MGRAALSNQFVYLYGRPVTTSGNFPPTNRIGVRFPMSKRVPEEVVAGVTIDRKGAVTVSAGYQQGLCDIALDLQEETTLPVDVEHVLAALVMAVRDGRLERGADVTHDPNSYRSVLLPYVELVFQRFSGNVLGMD